MKAPVKNSHSTQKDTHLRTLKHHINNQLSNIYIAIEQLRHEMPQATADCIFYLDSIATSAENIHCLVSDEFVNRQ